MSAIDPSALELSLPQKRVEDTIASRAAELRSDRRGRVLFVAGEPGSGRSHLIRSAARRVEVHGVRIAVGGLDDTATPQVPSELRRQVEALLTNAASALNPAISLIVPILGISVAAARMLGVSMGEVEPVELVIRVLRAAAKETPDRPLICLVDDGEWLDGSWWTELQFSFAKEIAELPMILVVGLAGDTRLGPTSEDEHPSRRAARSLVARSLADWLPLERMTRQEVDSWLQGAPRLARSSVRDLTAGRTGEAAELWRQWIAEGSLVEAEDGHWSIEESAILNDAAAQLAKRVDALVDSGGERLELVREALSLGALEGRTFTAEAVARAAGRDRESVEDLLDELTGDSPDEGVLREPRALEVSDLGRSKSRVIWRYEFTSRLLWRAARHRLDESDPSLSAARLLEALAQTYDQESSVIAPVMARLADLAEQPAVAARYRTLVSAPSRAARVAQAQYLMVADTQDWSSDEHRDASEILARAVLDLSYVKANSGLMPMADRALEHAWKATEASNRPIAVALWAKARLFFRLGAMDEAEAVLESACRLLSQGDPGLLAMLCSELFEVVWNRSGSPARAQELAEEALRLFRRVGDRSGEGASLYNLCQLALQRHDYDQARTLNDTVLQLSRAEGNRPQEMVAVFQQALLEFQLANYDAARSSVEEALRYQSAVGKTFSEAACLRLLGLIELAAEEPVKAREAARAALRLQRQIEHHQGICGALQALAEIEIEVGDPREAESLLLEAREMYSTWGDQGHINGIDELLRRAQAANDQ